MPKFYLGIDGGQSGTTALLADEKGNILGSGRSGPCNHVAASEGRAKFRSAIEGAMTQACQQAGLDRNTIAFASACLGFSGGAEDKESYARELIRSDRYKITHDAEIALSGATGGGPGMIIIAGTGSMAFGRNARGETGRAGGWGYVFGDEGGAFDLTRRALRAALEEEEGWGKPTALRSLLLRAADAVSINILLHRFYTPAFPRDKVASFAPLVTEAAQAGDEVALTILEAAAAELIRYVAGVYRHLFSTDSISLDERIPLAYIGGVFRSEPLRSYFVKAAEQGFACSVTAPRFQPVAGALLDALRVDGIASDLSGVPDFT